MRKTQLLAIATFTSLGLITSVSAAPYQDESAPETTSQYEDNPDTFLDNRWYVARSPPLSKPAAIVMLKTVGAAAWASARFLMNILMSR